VTIKAMKLKRAQMAKRKYTNACNIKQGYSSFKELYYEKSEKLNMEIVNSK